MWKRRIFYLAMTLCVLLALFPVISMAAQSKAPQVTITHHTGKYDGKPQLKWQAVEGAEHYEIYRAAKKDGEYTRMYSTTGCSYTNTHATPGKTYYYKVVAVTAEGERSKSKVVSIAAICAAPKVKCSLVDGSSYTGEPRLTWDAVEGAVKYKVYRSNTWDEGYALRTTTKKCSYTNTAAKHGRVYYYKVAAVDSAGNVSFSDPLLVAVKCARPEVTVQRTNGIYKDAPYVGKPMVQWLAVDGAKSYKVYRATSKNGSYRLMMTTSKPWYINTTAKSGTTYYYKVKAIGRDSEANSAYSKVKSLTTTAATPKSKIPKKTYTIKVNYQANTVTVYTYGKDGKYTAPVKAMICSTGSATPHSGTYSLASTGKWEWLSLFNNVDGHYVTQITGNILFHSVPYTTYGNPATLEYEEFDKLGSDASLGCVRLQAKDARWIYNHKSDIKAVTFYGSSDPGPLGKPVAPKISGNKTCRKWDPTDPDSRNPWRKATIKAGDYVGLTESKAVRKAGERGFTVQRIVYQHSAKPKGTVVTQSIPNGTKAAMNAKLTLTVSAGK